MQQNQTKRTLISLVAIAIFLFSMVYASSNATLSIHPVSDSVFEFTYAQDPGPPYEPEAGTHVWWDQNSNSTSDEWSWDHRNWLFGPSPTFEVYHENGSLLTGDSYAEIGEIIQSAFMVGTRPQTGTSLQTSTWALTLIPTPSTGGWLEAGNTTTQRSLVHPCPAS
jgi:hypothetical protein